MVSTISTNTSLFVESATVASIAPTSLKFAPAPVATEKLENGTNVSMTLVGSCGIAIVVVDELPASV